MCSDPSKIVRDLGRFISDKKWINISFCSPLIMEDPNKFTVKHLTALCIELGKKPPTGMRKTELIQLYQGLCKMAKEKIPFTEKYKGPDLRYTPVYCELRDGETWIQHLHRTGWATVPISDLDPDIYMREFFQWLKSLCNEFVPNNSQTWNDSNMPTNYHGVFIQYIGHTEWIWQIREKCVPIFEEIWKTSDLLCSFDGGCFLPCPPGQRKQWIHNDQPRSNTDWTCVQGLVNLLDNGPNDGGLLLMEGSHLIFKDYIDRHPIDGFTYFPADMKDPKLLQCRPIKICAPPGHIILWDGRTFHCNVVPTEQGRLRMCTYVSMQPRTGASQKEIDKRISVYEKGRMTSHWCYGPLFRENPEHPRSFGKAHIHPETVEIAQLNPLRRKLIGYPSIN